jgi:uncharacterized membrane protein
MTGHDVGLLLHILGVLVFFGGATVAGVVFEAARRRSRPSEIGLLLGVTRTAALLVMGGAAVVLLAGLWLAGDGDQWGEPWLLVSLALFVVSLALGALGGRRPKDARRLAAQLAEGRDEPTPELRRLLDDPSSRLANYGSTALVVVILVLMVWQPGR